MPDEQLNLFPSVVRPAKPVTAAEPTEGQPVRKYDLCINQGSIRLNHKWSAAGPCEYCGEAFPTQPRKKYD